MTQPTVACVMLTADRPELAKRAVECFRAQMYPAKKLLIYDTGAVPLKLSEWEPVNGFITLDRGVYLERYGDRDPRLDIAELRNKANRTMETWADACSQEELRSDILIHWDDDDWSHPDRITEQVALLQAGADLVGYNEMLFWRDRTAPRNTINGTGEAWIYTGDILGTSMAYWRKTWERVPFHPGGHHNEDAGFALGVRAAGMRMETVSTLSLGYHPFPAPACLRTPQVSYPRMIARIHAGNAKNPSYDPAQMAAHPHHWQRLPEWDRYCWYCEKVMEL